MSHPFDEHRQTKVEHSRVGHITKAYAKGGAVKHSDEKQDRKLVKSMIDKAIHPEGKKAKHRMDRPHRAKGGRVKKGNAKTIVNVITGGHPAAGAVPPGPPPPPMGIAGPPPGGPPVAAKPPMMPPPGGAPMIGRAKGGRVNQGSAVYEEGKSSGTQVQHSDGKGTANRPENLNRKKVITFASGGRVRRFEATDKISPATKLPGGGGGGEARLAKAHRAARK